MVCTGRLLEEPTLGKLVVWNASPRKDTFRLKHRYGLANVKNRSVSEIYILPRPLHASAHCLNSPTTTDSWLCFHPGCRSGSFPILKRLGSCLHQGRLPYCESVSGRISVLPRSAALGSLWTKVVSPLHVLTKHRISIALNEAQHELRRSTEQVRGEAVSEVGLRVDFWCFLTIH